MLTVEINRASIRVQGEARPAAKQVVRIRSDLILPCSKEPFSIFYSFFTLLYKHVNASKQGGGCGCQERVTTNTHLENLLIKFEHSSTRDKMWACSLKPSCRVVMVMVVVEESEGQHCF